MTRRPLLMEGPFPASTPRFWSPFFVGVLIGILLATGAVRIWGPRLPGPVPQSLPVPGAMP